VPGEFGIAAVKGGGGRSEHSNAPAL